MSAESPRLLAIDASSEQCSVAVSSDGKTESETCDTPKSHARVILLMVDKLLAAARLSLPDLDAVLVSLGPGSFTGIRICLSIAQGLAYGAQLPLLGASSLEVLAKTLSLKAQQPGELLVPCLDARMNEIYWAVYRCREGKLLPVSAPRVTEPAALSHYLGLNAPYIGAGHGWLLESLSSHVIDAGRVYADMPPHAEGLLLLWDEKFKLQCRADTSRAPIEPLYLRNEVAWEKRVRIRENRGP